MAEKKLPDILSHYVLPESLDGIFKGKCKHCTKTRNKEHTACLERRLNLWNEGELDDLIVEGIQSRLLDSFLPRADTPD